MKAEAFSLYARYYDLLNRDKNYAEEARFVDGLLRSAGAPTGALLDVGCGTGAHAREFAKLGWRVSGVDLSSAMIEIARERTAGNAEIEFFSGAAAEFDRGQSFTAIVALFHVVSYHSRPEDAYRMFVNVHRHLVPGGIFVFDFWHGPGVLADPPAIRVRRAENDGIRVTRIAEPTHRPLQCRVDVSYEILVENLADSRIEHIEEFHRMRYFFLPEIEFMLKRAGFGIERTHAGLVEENLNVRSWHGLVMARAD
jgi:SAM-dependent methyltransferase